MPTLPVPNQQSAIAEIRKNSAGKLLAYLIPPWNSWFQQFSQPAPKAVAVTVSPFTANSNGTLILNGAAGVSITRGTTVIALAGASIVIPIAIGDTINFTGGTATFLGA